MKYHLVFDHKYNFRGYLPDKNSIYLFKKQRHMDQFHIHAISEEKFTEKFNGGINLGDYEAVNNYGYIMFPDEELYMFEGFDQMIMDFKMTMAYFLRDYKPFVKFTDDEMEKIEGFMQVIHSILEEHSVMVMDDDQVYEQDQHFKMDYMMKIILQLFGGK